MFHRLNLTSQADFNATRQFSFCVLTSMPHPDFEFTCQLSIIILTSFYPAALIPKADFKAVHCFSIQSHMT
jgi:hypothetical protein